VNLNFGAQSHNIRSDIRFILRKAKCNKANHFWQITARLIKNSHQSLSDEFSKECNHSIPVNEAADNTPANNKYK
jgi:hypothetical protein